MTSCRRALLWAIAAMLAVATPAVHAATVAQRELSAQLPAGVTLGKASIDQTAAALKAAVIKHRGAAVPLLVAAIRAKMLPGTKLDCADLDTLTKAATDADKADTQKLVDAAASEDPDCTDSLNSLLTRNAGFGALEDDLNSPTVNNGFAAGLGAGFAGSPGFSGSAPSGTFAFPPVVTSGVTVTTNQ